MTREAVPDVMADDIPLGVECAWPRRLAELAADEARREPVPRLDGGGLLLLLLLVVAAGQVR